MWSQFLISCLVCGILLYVPGFLLLLSTTRMSWASAFAVAPLLDVACYAILAVVFNWLGIEASFATLALPVMTLAVIVLLVRTVCEIRKSRSLTSGLFAKKRTEGLPVLCLYVLVGVVVTGYFFVRGLDGAASFFQAYDNGNHLNMIRSFLESSDYSSFNTSSYVLSDGMSVSPFVEGAGSFYPAAWHCVVALVADATGAPVTLCLNATNAVLLGVVFPAGAYELLTRLFPERRLSLLLGSVISVGFVSLLWDFVSWGPLYPMLLSYALVPATTACFISLFSGDSTVGMRERARQGALFFAGCLAIALAQPSGIFVMAVLLAPFLVWQAYRIVSERSKLRSARWASVLVTAVVIAIIWMTCYSSSFFSDVVNFTWPMTVSLRQAVIDVALLSMTSHPAQLVMAFFVVVGIVVALSRREERWMVAAYAIAAFTYVLSVATEGSLKHIMAGFWYTDPHRLAANVSLAAIPLAVLGATFAFDVLRALFDAAGTRVSRCPSGRFLAGAAMVVSLASVFYPSYELRGFGSKETAFGNLESTIQTENSVQEAQVLDAQELEFVQDVLSVVPEGSLIINSPNDGSGFLYALYGVNVYYREFALPSDASEETDASWAIRLSLDEISSNEGVRDAVRAVGAQYVLVLDQGSSDSPRFWSYYPEQWEGIESIDDDTEGFEAVLARDDMRLYKIVSEGA